MTIHSIILSFVLASLLGAVFHVLRGGSLRRLGLHLLAANLSFFIGHWLSELIHWQLLRIGAINLFPSVLATIIGLILTTTLAGEEPETNSKKKPRRKRRK
jgi:hypothetical protein